MHSRLHRLARLPLRVCATTCWRKALVTPRLFRGSLDSSRCPPEGGRYIGRNQVFSHTSEGCGLHSLRGAGGACWFQEIGRCHQFTGGWPWGCELLPSPGELGGGMPVPECGFCPAEGWVPTTAHSPPCRSSAYSTCIAPLPCLRRNSTCAVAWSPLTDICFTSRSITERFRPATLLRCLSMLARMAS